MFKTLALNSKEMAALRVTAITGGVWLFDAGSKWLATHRLAPGITTAIPNFLYFIPAYNHGGSNGIPSEFMELCLALPATIMFCVALTLGRNLRAGKKITLIQQLGLGLFLGGALSNWSERVLHGAVTDFICLKPFGFCIFNCADVFIDCGNLIFLVETVRILLRRRA